MKKLQQSFRGGYKIAKNRMVYKELFCFVYRIFVNLQYFPILPKVIAKKRDYAKDERRWK